MDVALTRDVSPALAECALTFRARQPIDPARAAAQHEAYCALLAGLGLEVVRLPADPALPDCCFVEDVALVLDELAILTSPGVASRRGELDAMARELPRHRERVARIEPPATLEGGDVLRVGRALYVGLGPRTNAAGVDALRALVEPHDYTVSAVAVTGCLHLKSAVTALDDETLVANRAWLDMGPLAHFRVVDVAPGEPDATNVLRVREQLVASASFPRTLERLAAAGFEPTTLDVSEFEKAEAALTCKSILFRR